MPIDNISFKRHAHPRMWTPGIICGLILLLVCQIIGAIEPPTARGRIIQLPNGAITPDVVVDAKGVVHMVFGLDYNAYYSQSTDNYKTFSAPVKLNADIGVTITMGERGPKLALGKEGSIHVIWQDRWSPGVHVFARYTRSLDGGKSFETPRPVSDVWGMDGTTLTADADGNVAVFWHAMDDRKPDVPQATWLYLTRSGDNGATFGKSEPVHVKDIAGLACSMCQMRARAIDGSVYLAFRNAEGNIRDFYMLKSQITANDFTAVRVNQDNWKIATCPMCGPELTLAPDGRALCAFMSEHKVYWAISDKQRTAFSLHVATPANEQDEIYPTVLANRKGEVLFLWQVGPMSVNGTAVVKWATYAIDGKLSGRQGTLGSTTSGTKAAAFVGSDDNFYIVTTAK